MTDRVLRFTTWLAVRHPAAVLSVIAALTAVLYSHIPSLRLETDLTRLFGSSTPEWHAINDLTQRLGYTNQLFVVVESLQETETAADTMEAAAERLVAEMNASGRFKHAKCSLSEEELLGIVRLFAWHFPSFVTPERREAFRERLADAGVREAVRRGGTGLITALSGLGASYFLTDPLGLMELTAPAGSAFGSALSFDLDWGSGGHFFSRDHKALLIIAEPGLPATDYESAEIVVQWTRQHTRAIEAEEDFRRAGLRFTLAGALVYAEQDRRFIQRNIRLVSLVSILGNLLLCLLVYRRLPMLVMAWLPTSLGILWTTGLISYYPGEVNLISLSFIAILAGLGDDQVTYFFNRVPQEWTAGRKLEEAMTATFMTTGRSILFCILTTGTATLSLALARFKGLAEFGFILTVGLVMLLVHTLFTVPALMHLWWTRFPPRAPQSASFRFLPAVGSALADLLARHARLIFAVSAAVFVLCLLSLSRIRFEKRIEITRSGDNPAIVGQKRLAQRFGLEDTPELILIQGSEEDVLRRAEALTAALEDLKRQGRLKSVFSPTQILPSPDSQLRRARLLDGIDLQRTVAALKSSLADQGFKLEYFAPAIAQLQRLARDGARPLRVEEALAYLPRGMLDNSIRKAEPNRYVAAVGFYAAAPDANTATIPAATMKALEQKAGPLVEFSFFKLNRDLQAQISRDSVRALLVTLAGIAGIVLLCFRSLPMMGLVLAPIAFAGVGVYGVLFAGGHRFSFMALAAVPLITGIGIDNSIHLVRRYMESASGDIVEIAKVSAAPLIQSNLTTIIGFGALMVSEFEPLAELGLMTATGVAMALVGAIWVIPAAVLVLGRRRAGGAGR